MEVPPLSSASLRSSHAEMAKKPLKLDWEQILAENEVKSPTLELEVVHTPLPSITSTTDASLLQLELSTLTDLQLEERLQRQVKLYDSGIATNLPDNGKKLLASIRLLKEELDQRKTIRLKKSAKKCDTPIESQTAEDIGVLSTSLHATSKSDSPNFGSLFTRKMEKMAVSRSTSKISSCDTSKMHERVNSCSISSRLSLRKKPFRPASKLTPTKKRRSINTNCSSINTSTFYSPCIGRRYSKRLKDSEELWGTLKSKKVQNVVLLDEEDVQSKDLSEQASDDWKEVKIYYPSRDDPQSVELSYSDMKCLEPKQYISSPIMNFYIRYLQRPIPVSEPQNEYYFFNTYFYGKLEDSLLTSKCDKSLRFSKLRRWWKGVNIFEKAYIFLPIHKSLHWSLVIISIPPKEDKSCAIILHLDSLSMHDSKDILHVIQCYLTEEWNRVKPASEKILIEKKKITVPQQENEYDCGLFVLYFMDRFIEEAPQRLESKDLHMFGRKWFQPEEASGLRKRLKDLLLEEFESSRLECGREETHDSSSSSPETEEQLSIIQS